MTLENCKLSPERFTWEKYCGKLGWSIGQLITDPYSYYKNLKHIQPDVTLVGWCEANRIRIRSRAEGFVIMVEIDGEDTWFHCMELPEIT